MRILVSNHCWFRWSAVIRKLAQEYNFPASGHGQLHTFLRTFDGDGSTFRLSNESWKFVIDVTRRGGTIEDIIAITVTAKSKQDPRCNGKVITRACTTHKHPDLNQPGAPVLQWMDVTSGGMSYRKCCDGECRGSEKASLRPRLSWETVRLKIIQKAYEQEVLLLTRMIENSAKRLSKAREEISQKSLEIKTLSQLVDEKSGQVALLNESATTAGSQQPDTFKKKEAQFKKKMETLYRKKQAFYTKKEAFYKKAVTFYKKKRSFDEKKKAFSKERKESGKEKRLPQTQQQSPEAESGASRLKDEAMETCLTEMRKLEYQLDKERTSKEQRLQDLQYTNEVLEDRIRRLENEKTQAESKSLTKIREMEKEVTKLRRNVEGLELKHRKHTETHQAEVQELNATNARIQNSKRSVDHYVHNLDVRVKKMEDQAKQDSDVITKLEAENQIRKDQVTRAEEAHSRAHKDFHDMVSRHMNQVTDLKNQIREKDEALRRSENDMMDARATILNLQRGNEMYHQMFPTQPYPPISQSDLETQRKLQDEAAESIVDLRSKLNATELEVRAKTAEVAALGRKCADKTAALDYQEKKCFDYASKLATMRSEVDAARSRAEGAEKRYAEEAAGLKEDAEASKDRVHELEMECANKAAAANEMEKRCKDKEAYAAGLEEQLELVRGTMEGALQQVSKRHGKKRRRTEGPDFDY